MAMAGRHIRHDWKEFVAWDQKSVRTVCGKTSTWNATGIPGVTEQPEIVDAGGKDVYGWCTMCAVEAYRVVGHLPYDNAPNIHPYILPMYEEVFRIVKPIYDAYVQRMEATRQRSRRRLQ